MDLDDLRGDATHKIYGICFNFYKKKCGDSLILNLQMMKSGRKII